MPNESDGGSQTPPAEQKYVTEEAFNASLNAAVTSHMKRLEKQFAGALEAALKPVNEKLAAPPAAVTPPAETVKSPEYLALQKQLEEMKQAVTREAEARAAAERKHREDRAYSDLRSQLEGKVRPELRDMVAAHLFKVENRIDFEEDGTPVFKAKQKTFGGVEEDVRYTLKDGVDTYLKSEEAKAFLPAPATASSSPLPKRTVQPGRSGFDPSAVGRNDFEKIQMAEAMEAELKKLLG